MDDEEERRGAGSLDIVVHIIQLLFQREIMMLCMVYATVALIAVYDPGWRRVAERHIS